MKFQLIGCDRICHNPVVMWPHNAKQEAIMSDFTTAEDGGGPLKMDNVLSYESEHK
jgi:hypothetical protein